MFLKEAFRQKRFYSQLIAQPFGATPSPGATYWSQIFVDTSAPVDF